MNCPNCGMEIPDGGYVCPHCHQTKYTSPWSLVLVVLVCFVAFVFIVYLYVN